MTSAAMPGDRPFLQPLEEDVDHVHGARATLLPALAPGAPLSHARVNEEADGSDAPPRRHHDRNSRE